MRGCGDATFTTTTAFDGHGIHSMAAVDVGTVKPRRTGGSCWGESGTGYSHGALGIDCCGMRNPLKVSQTLCRVRRTAGCFLYIMLQ